MFLFQKDTDSDDPEVLALKKVFQNAKDINSTYVDLYQRNGMD